MDCSLPGCSVRGDSPGNNNWSGLPFHSPENFPDPWIKPRSPALQAEFSPSEPWGKPVARCPFINAFCCSVFLSLRNYWGFLLHQIWIPEHVFQILALFCPSLWPQTCVLSPSSTLCTCILCLPVVPPLLPVFLPWSFWPKLTVCAEESFVKLRVLIQ